MTSSRSEFVDMVPPVRERLRLYDGTRKPTDQPKNDAADPAKATPESFIDAMIVREAVFVDEQHVPLENELDEDDANSYHWVAYASLPSLSTTKDTATSATSAADSATDKSTAAEVSTSTPANESPPTQRKKSTNSTKVPIGTIRIVVPPHPPHPNGEYGTTVHDPREPYVKIGRLAVIREFRKAGISRLLIETALGFVREHAWEMLPAAEPSKMEAAALRQSATDATGGEFRGLVLAHAQVGVQKVWARYGFVTDDSMGVWDEEGIDHVGMWKRVEAESGSRRVSRLLSS